jgi:hypothetical protein
VQNNKNGACFKIILKAIKNGKNDEWRD